jgi:hypothetical protein
MPVKQGELSPAEQRIYERITELARHLGRLPTYAEVQAQGGGSLRDIGTALRAYRDAQQPPAATIAVPPEVGQAVGVLWAAALAVADAKLAGQREALGQERAALAGDVDEALRAADERNAAAAAERDTALRAAAAAGDAADADRRARAAEADARRGAEVAAGEARAALATLREEYAVATAALRRDYERALSEAVRQAADDEARRAAERERAVAEEISLLRAAERDARSELAAAHEHELQAERASAERHIAELRMALAGQIDVAIGERDAARADLETVRDELQALRVRTEVAERLADERRAALKVAQRDLSTLIAHSARWSEDPR